jgi:hypothetical protein
VVRIGGVDDDRDFVVGCPVLALGGVVAADVDGRGAGVAGRPASLGRIGANFAEFSVAVPNGLSRAAEPPASAPVATAVTSRPKKSRPHLPSAVGYPQ